MKGLLGIFRRPTVALAAEEAPKNGAARIPSAGSVLRQFDAISRLLTDVPDILGVFNPRLVGHKTRLLMLEDPIIAFGIAIHRGAITNLPWTVESRDPEIGAFVEAVLERIFDQFALGISMAIPLGWKVCEKVWAVEDLLVEVESRKKGEISADDKVIPNAWIIEKTKTIANESLRLLVDPARDEWAGVDQSFMGLVQPDKVVGPEHVVLWSHRAEEVDGKLSGKPLLNQVYEPWWNGAATELLTNRYFERKADPSVIGHGPAEIIGPGGKPIDGHQWLLDQAVAIRSGSSIAVDSKRDEKGNPLVDFKYLTDDKRGDMFQLRIDALDLKKLRGLLITDRVMAAGAGGLGTGDADFQADVLAEFLEGNRRHFLGAVLNLQIVDPVVRYNYGDERWKQSRTRVVAGGLAKAMKDMLRDVIKTVLQADSMITDGRPTQLLERLDIEGVARSLKLPMRPAEESKQLQEERKKALEEAGTMAEPELGDEGAERARRSFEERGVKDREGSREE
ncbi:MAG: phage portal protein family protein [Vicinamibacteria bacterium]